MSKVNYDIEDYYIDMSDIYDEEDASDKQTARFQRTNRKIFSKRRKDLDKLDSEISRSNKRESKRLQKEAFFDSE